MVKVRVRMPARFTLQDIGNLDFEVNIPPVEGLKCSRCGEKINPPSQVTLGAKAGFRGYFAFHPQCVAQQELFDDPKKESEKKEKKSKKKTKTVLKKTGGE